MADTPTPALERPSRPLSPEEQVERWDREWLSYLSREYPEQLRPYTTYPRRPELPNDPLRMIDVSLADHTSLAFYASGEAIRDRVVLEFGCGCGGLGKLVAGYARSYVGIDWSPLALSIARLVSPPNAVYLHPSQTDELNRLVGTADTLVSRFFWIHQNFETGRRVLSVAGPLLKPGALLYFDFFWPNPGEAVGFWRSVDRLRSPDDTLDDEPSAMFPYAASDVERLLRDLPFRILSQHEHGPTQRRYVVAQKI